MGLPVFLEHRRMDQGSERYALPCIVIHFPRHAGIREPIEDRLGEASVDIAAALNTTVLGLLKKFEGHSDGGVRIYVK